MAETIVHSGEKEGESAPPNPEHSHELGEHGAKIEEHSGAIDELKGAIGSLAEQAANTLKAVETLTEQSAHFVTHESLSAVGDQISAVGNRVEEIAAKIPERIEHEVEPVKAPERTENEPQKRGMFSGLRRWL